MGKIVLLSQKDELPLHVLVRFLIIPEFSINFSQIFMDNSFDRYYKTSSNKKYMKNYFATLTKEIFKKY